MLSLRAGCGSTFRRMRASTAGDRDGPGSHCWGKIAAAGRPPSPRPPSPRSPEDHGRPYAARRPIPGRLSHGCPGVCAPPVAPGADRPAPGSSPIPRKRRRRQRWNDDHPVEPRRKAASRCDARSGGFGRRRRKSAAFRRSDQLISGTCRPLSHAWRVPSQCPHRGSWRCRDVHWRMALRCPRPPGTLHPRASAH